MPFRGDGPAGATGAAGPQGNTGATGAAGAAGTPVWQGNWAAGTYHAGDAVAHNGSSYVANATTTDEPPSSHWDVLANGGSQGITAVRVALAFDTPNFLLVGTPVWTPTPGDTIISACFSILSDGFQDAGNTVTPYLHLGHAGALDDLTTPMNGPWDIQDADSPVGAHMATVAVGNARLLPKAIGNAAPWNLSALDAAPLYAMYDDGSGGDPVCVQGAGSLILLIVAA